MSTASSSVPEFRTPHVLGRIFWTETIQALIRLSGGNFTDKRYYSAGSISLQSIAGMHTPEEWEKQRRRIEQRYPHGIPGMWQDIAVLCSELTAWDDVRELYRVGFLTSVCIPHILARLIEQGKATYVDLQMEDRAIFDYTEQQMSALIATGCAIHTFSPMIQERIVGIIGQKNV